MVLRLIADSNSTDALIVSIMVEDPVHRRFSIAPALILLVYHETDDISLHLGIGQVVTEHQKANREFTIINSIWSHIPMSIVRMIIAKLRLGNGPHIRRDKTGLVITNFEPGKFAPII